MDAWRLPDRLWAMLEPLVPAEQERPKGGRPPVPARRARGDLVRHAHGLPLAGAQRHDALLLRHGRAALPRVEAGRRVRTPAPEQLGYRARSRRDRLGLPRRGRVPREGAAVAHRKRGPSRLDRRKQGSKWAAIVDRGGLVLALAVAGGDRHDLPPAREALARLRVPPDARPGVFAADGAFDDAAFRAAVAALGFTADIPRNPRKTGRPKERRFVPGRWVVERTHAHLGGFRAVRTRWCRLLQSYRAFLATAAAHRIVRQARL
jgi:transposase